jgi:hypothetical protein
VNMNPQFQYCFVQTLSDRYKDQGNDALESHETIRLYIVLDENSTPRDVSLFPSSLHSIMR